MKKFRLGLWTSWQRDFNFQFLLAMALTIRQTDALVEHSSVYSSSCKYKLAVDVQRWLSQMQSGLQLKYSYPDLSSQFREKEGEKEQ